MSVHLSAANMLGSKQSETAFDLLPTRRRNDVPFPGPRVTRAPDIFLGIARRTRETMNQLLRGLWGTKQCLGT